MRALKLSNGCCRYEICEVSSLLECYLAPQVHTVLTSHCAVPPRFHLKVLECLNNALLQQWASCGAEVDDRWLFWPYRAVQLLSVRPHVGCCVSATTANWYYWTAMEGSPQHLQKWPGTHWQRSGRKQIKGQTCAIWHGLILSACKAGWELQKCCIDLCTYVPWIINGNFNLCEFLKCLLPFELSFSLVCAFVKT